MALLRNIVAVVEVLGLVGDMQMWWACSLASTEQILVVEAVEVQSHGSPLPRLVGSYWHQVDLDSILFQVEAIVSSASVSISQHQLNLGSLELKITPEVVVDVDLELRMVEVG